MNARSFDAFLSYSQAMNLSDRQEDPLLFDMLYTAKEVMHDDCYQFGMWSDKLKGTKGPKAVFDIGANVGVFSSMADELLQREKRIYAFEPCRSNFRKLLKYGPSVAHCFPIGLGVGEMLHFNPSDEGMRVKKLLPSLITEDSESAYGAPLAELMMNFPVRDIPTFIKIDCEGGELALLSSANEAAWDIFKDVSGFGIEIHPEIIGSDASNTLIEKFRTELCRSVEVKRQHKCLILTSIERG